MKYLSLFLFLLLGSVAHSQTIRYVDINNATPVSPFTNGWASAATNIQDALTAIPHNHGTTTILVNDGVYNNGTIVAPATFAKNRVLITNHNIRLISVNGPDATQIHGRWHAEDYSEYPPSTNNAFGANAVRCMFITGTNAFISGFTFKYGSTTNNYASNTEGSGGGIMTSPPATARPTISNCVFDLCASATEANIRGHITVYDTKFTRLFTQLSNRGTILGSAGLVASEMKFYNCTFENIQNNQLFSGSVGELYNCVISNVSATIGSSLIVSGRVYNLTNGPSGNAANHIYDSYIKNSDMKNFALINNHAENVAIIDCTNFNLVNGNIGSTSINTIIISSKGNWVRGGGSGNMKAWNLTIINSSFSFGLSAQTNSFFIYNSLFFSNSFPTLNWNPYNIFTNDNFDINTHFIDFENGDYRLRSTSPAINYGDNQYVVTDTDFYGHPRISGGTVDAGASEYFDYPIVLPYGDWEPLYRAMERSFPVKEQFTVKNLNIADIPESDEGLEEGDLWWDGANVRVVLP